MEEVRATRGFHAAVSAATFEPACDRWVT